MKNVHKYYLKEFLKYIFLQNIFYSKTMKNPSEDLFYV